MSNTHQMCDAQHIEQICTHRQPAFDQVLDTSTACACICMGGKNETISAPRFYMLWLYRGVSIPVKQRSLSGLWICLTYRRVGTHLKK